MEKAHPDYADEPKGELNTLTDSKSKAGTGEAKGGRPGEALTFAKHKQKQRRSRSSFA
jgi:hypothetical protein